MPINKQLTPNFYVIGISYKKADAETRGQFSLQPDQYEHLLDEAPDFGIRQAFVISTCNRTEIYGMAFCPHQLTHLLCKHVEGSARILEDKGYLFKNEEAVRHFLKVAGGLDSQILGDYEIVGQIKQATRFAKERGRLGTYTERLINTALAASKDIKNQTRLSSGTVSVSYSTVQYLKTNIADLHTKRVMIVGVGKIGTSVCKNLLSYTPLRNFTVVNRTKGKAENLAAQFGLTGGSMEDFDTFVAESDIIILATSSSQPILHPFHLAGRGEKLIIDLSIPRNIDHQILKLPNVTFADVDELSREKDTTLFQRRAETPKAEKIISHYLSDFLAWKEKRKYAPFLNAIKTTLEKIDDTRQLPSFPGKKNGSGTELKIQRIVRHYAQKVKKDNRYGCHFIEAVNQYLNP